MSWWTHFLNSVQWGSVSQSCNIVALNFSVVFTSRPLLSSLLVISLGHHFVTRKHGLSAGVSTTKCRGVRLRIISIPAVRHDLKSSCYANKYQSKDLLVVTNLVLFAHDTASHVMIGLATMIYIQCRICGGKLSVTPFSPDGVQKNTRRAKQKL